MTIENLKQEIYEIAKELPITNENKQFYKGHIITILGEKYSYRAEYDENLFGKVIDEVLDELLVEPKKTR